MGEIEAVILDCAGYGYRRVTHELRRRGRQINHKGVQRIMRQQDLKCRVRRRPPRSNDPTAVMSNLLRADPP